MQTTLNPQISATSTVVTLNLPAGIEQSLAVPAKPFPRWILEAIATEGYRQVRLSHAEVGTLLGMNWHETEEFLAQNKAYLPYTADDIEADLSKLQRLRENRKQ